MIGLVSGVATSSQSPLDAWVSNKENATLLRAVAIDEIREVVWFMIDDKALGLGSFPISSLGDNGPLWIRR